MEFVKGGVNIIRKVETNACGMFTDL